jgi:hypothetical protein
MMNLLQAALSVIPPSTVIWIRATGRTQNALGQWVTTYAAPVDLRGSFQPLEKAKYEALGLDMNKHYRVFYVSQPVAPVDRGTSGDRLIHDGRLYQVEDEADWYSYNGWLGLVCVDIGAAA